MTLSPIPALDAIPDTKLREILDGCADVTPGPWQIASDHPALAIMALKPDGSGGHRVVQTENQNNYRHFGTSQQWHGIQSYANANHIARLDPATVASIVSELLRLRANHTARADVAEGYVLVPLDDATRPFADSLLPSDMIEAGAVALETADEDLQNYVAGETIDWDYHMEAVAVYRAMTAASPSQGDSA